ncbi:MAG: hypothetical protein SVQ76_01630 [Candidatus Nanohaloarchaea archaeon]|nr:hypothetical protein [Candidatus Nanohaloarchaea archaeon]
MNAEAVFNRYDIRGEYPEEIDEDFAERLGKAVGTRAVREGRGKVVTGRDDREASEAVYPAFIRGLRSTGANLVDIGVGTTDRTALAASHYGGTGAMVTASHHSWKRTGFKLLHERGNGFSNQDLEDVEELFRGGDFETGEGTLINEQNEFDEIYIEELEERFDEDALEGAKVVLDAVGGSGRTAPAVFEELGAKVVEHRRDGRPDPEPGKDNRSEVKARMEEEEADLAVGYDPDGDRVYVFHPEEGWIDGDNLFYLISRIVEPDTVVASVDTSPLIEEVGAEVEYTRVGDIFVSERGVQIGADLLGEPNGHYAVPDFSWYNSGILSSLLMASRHRDISGMLEEVEDYSTDRYAEAFEDVEEREEAMKQVKRRVAKNYEVVSTVDGLKFEGEGFTGLVRPSGTSPKIRLVVHVEGESEDGAGEVRKTVFG